MSRPLVWAAELPRVPEDDRAAVPRLGVRGPGHEVRFGLHALECPIPSELTPEACPSCVSIVAGWSGAQAFKVRVRSAEGDDWIEAEVAARDLRGAVLVALATARRLPPPRLRPRVDPDPAPELPPLAPASRECIQRALRALRRPRW